MKKSNRFILSARLLAFLLALGVALVGGPAMGQNQGEEDDEFMLEDVVVTGSRIPRRDYESYSPIVTIKAETFEDLSALETEFRSKITLPTYKLFVSNIRRSDIKSL